MRQDQDCGGAPTSSTLGMMSLSHCCRKRSLSKAGSTRRISVSTSDISVFENRPPGGSQARSRWGARNPSLLPAFGWGWGAALGPPTHPAGL